MRHTPTHTHTWHGKIRRRFSGTLESFDKCNKSRRSRIRAKTRKGSVRQEGARTLHPVANKCGNSWCAHVARTCCNKEFPCQHTVRGEARWVQGKRPPTPTNCNYEMRWHGGRERQEEWQKETEGGWLHWSELGRASQALRERGKKGFTMQSMLIWACSRSWSTHWLCPTVPQCHTEVCAPRPCAGLPVACNMLKSHHKSRRVCVWKLSWWVFPFHFQQRMNRRGRGREQDRVLEWGRVRATLLPLLVFVLSIKSV